MKICRNCGQAVAQDVDTCPSCGADVGQGRERIDDYRILEVLHEGHASIVCKALKEGEEVPVSIRIFTPEARVSDEVAYRLKLELEPLKKLPPEQFMVHYELTRSSDGLWYRVSEWIDAERWGDLVGSEEFDDYETVFRLFSKIARALGRLQEEGFIIPHLILNDIVVFRKEDGELDIKIDYKISRFLDPKLDLPSPMLKHLLECHPDIRNGRPLEHRSDIWSLGKVFVEILTADYDTCEYAAKVDELPLPENIEALFKTMLAEDQDLRPSTMEHVAQALDRTTKEEIREARQAAAALASDPAETRAIKKNIARTWGVIGGLILVFVVVFSWFWHQSDLGKKDNAALLTEYANKYSPSVAFVMVEYWLTEGGRRYYRQRTEGTAFLVSQDGYLITNRHVACPWLEDENFFRTVAQLKASGMNPILGYRLMLWFEGEKAFNRTAGFIESVEMEDAYFTDKAYRSDGEPAIRIVGVAKPPIATRKVVFAPLRDDFAILKIDKVPDGLTPLPLETKIPAKDIPKLSRIIVIGFPLGQRTQAETVNASATRGHVRRSFKDLIHIDASLYGGNSGGPVLNMQGKVIGIASGVVTDRAPGPLPLVTPLWDMGMVQPVFKVAAFLEEIKDGHVKWNGILDLSARSKIARITKTARESRWAEAAQQAEEEVSKSSDPALTLTAGMMNFCADNMERARFFLERSLSMEPRNNPALMMLYLIDWLEKKDNGTYKSRLEKLDWRSPVEIFGFLERYLENPKDRERFLTSWDSRAEKGWLNYIAALAEERAGRLIEAENLLKAALVSAGLDSWEFILAQSRLDRVQGMLRKAMKDRYQRAEYGKAMADFRESLAKTQKAKEKARERDLPLLASVRGEGTGIQAKQEALLQLLAHEPDNGSMITNLAFYQTLDGKWDKASQALRPYLERTGRESGTRLSASLLRAELLLLRKKPEEANKVLVEFQDTVQDEWYRTVAQCLSGKISDDELTQRSGQTPEYLLVASTAKGLWAQGKGDKGTAIKYYRTALESFLDTWLEYEFALESLKKLRREEK